MPYELLLHILTESMDYVIEKMKYKPALDYHRKILDAMKAKDEVLAERGGKVSFFPLRHQFP